MDSKLKGLSVVLLVFFMVILFALPAYAQEGSSGESEESGELGDYEKMEPEERQPSPEEFGTTKFIYTWVPATAFLQSSEYGVGTTTGGYLGRTAEGGKFFTATLDLPTGVDIWGIRVYLYDSSSTGNITGYFYRRNPDIPSTTELKIFSTAGNVGYTTITWDPNMVFDNFHQYQLRVILNETVGNHRFLGARIKYLRFIPIATTNTFVDVHPSDWYFPNVEALVAAGITTGWGGGSEFKPNYYVTRAQMAAFISRALGLYHPETSPY